MKKLFISLMLILAMVSTVFANSNELWEKSTLNQIIKKGVFRVAMDPGYMPFEMTSKKGGFIGFDIDLAKLMAKKMGVKLKMVAIAWDGIIPALLTDKCDIIMGGMTITQKRNLQVNFAEPYIVVGQTILIRKGLVDKIKSYKDLNDPKYTISAKLGTTGDIAVKKYMPKAKARQYETEAEAVIEVGNNRVDAFVYDLPFNAIYSAQHPDKVYHLSKPFTYEPLGFAIRKGDPDFLNWINNFLRQIKGDGTYDKLYHKWFEKDDWLKQIQ